MASQRDHRRRAFPFHLLVLPALVPAQTLCPDNQTARSPPDRDTCLSARGRRHGRQTRLGLLSEAVPCVPAAFQRPPLTRTAARGPGARTGAAAPCRGSGWRGSRPHTQRSSSATEGDGSRLRHETAQRRPRRRGLTRWGENRLDGVFVVTERACLVCLPETRLCPAALAPQAPPGAPHKDGRQGCHCPSGGLRGWQGPSLGHTKLHSPRVATQDVITHLREPPMPSVNAPGWCHAGALLQAAPLEKRRADGLGTSCHGLRASLWQGSA